MPYPSVTISLKIPSTLKKKLEWLAELKEMSVSEYIRSLIERELPESERKDYPKTHPLLEFINRIDTEDEQVKSFSEDIMNARLTYTSREVEEL